jgi:hypothetical protein
VRKSVVVLSRVVLVGAFAALVASTACSSTTILIVNGDGGVADGATTTSSGASGASSSGTSGTSSGTSGASSGTSGASSGTSGASSGKGGSSGTSGASSGTSGTTGDGGDLCTPPGSVTYTKTWKPPHPHQAACSQADIDLFRQVCLGTQSDGGAACKAFTGTAAGKACEECIIPSTGAALGVLLVTGGYVSPNIAGCIAIAQNTVADGAGCASASLYLSECRAAACGACSKDPNTTPDMINACDTAADTGACQAESAAAGCLDQIADAGGAAAACLGGTDFDSTYSAIAPIFCLQ